MSQLLEDTVQYMKEQPGFEKLLRSFRSKYESLGRVGGSVRVDAYADAEVESIALFMGISPHHLRRKPVVTLQAFEKRLGETKFTGVTLHEVLSAYFGQELVSKRELREAVDRALAGRLAEWKAEYPLLAPWLERVEGAGPDTQWIRRHIQSGGFEGEMALLARAYAALPETYERLPIFSQRVSGDPHTFDLMRISGKLLLHLLHVQAGEEGPPPSQTEAVNELLLSYRLLRDDMTNYVSVANFVGETPDGHEQPVWRAAADSGSVLNMPLRELLKVQRVRTSGQGGDVYIVENSGVFSALLDKVPDTPLVCTHGQFKLAGLILMDKLAEAGYLLHYNGDFDPEGIALALRFKRRYKEKGRLWRMNVEDYYASKPSVLLGERVNKLASLRGQGDDELVEAVISSGKAGYQEGLLGQLEDDVR
ncbi:TIGR02679 family protein [Shouchella shacheensis]|uniref:TIGR02679 family protein n=1 Tax=Shouchella shacheensis TaxID=1649580 RepID=UPI0007402320|nr:TIGR02679 family protein [Shouchella shacheensis]